MRTIFLLAFVVLVTACSHPIEIVGKGDVFAWFSNPPRVCSWEDYLGGADSCVKNYVVGDYKLTYAANPEWPDWYFDHWENYCTDDTLGECSFDIPAEAVRQMWGESAPPLVAVFVERDGSPVPESKIITANGREWIRPRMFWGVQWSEIAALCLPGPCTGELMGFDITGWTWAAVEDVNSLFNQYIGTDDMGPGPDFYQRAGVEWLEPFWGNNWGQTHNFVPGDSEVRYLELRALMRDCFFDAERGRDVTPSGVVMVWFPFEQGIPYGAFATDIFAGGSSCEDAGGVVSGTGAWLYRELP